ncbi:phosphodiester glycosidase family protein [Aureimonas phyllosphaerae]|uniref:phosphodiester glycosidase family protein n=1 Tax=Aureimonas phyllosphaerae TaxID=1166078 RepID=UPI003A5BA26D
MLRRVAAIGLVCQALWLQPATAEEAGGPCAPDAFEDARYLVCTVDPAASDLRLFWRGADEAPFRRFERVAQSLEAEGHRLVFAVNAGMYDTDFSPIGLYVENGRELRPLDRTVMTGSPGSIPNFYKQPNGVFFLGEAGAGILSSDAFETQRPAVRFATQSGPMLVIGGALHPALIPGSSDRTRRSGVGVCANGAVRVAISEGRVNFHDFARLFRDHLGCPDALFLDGGNGTGLYDPAQGRDDTSWHGGYGPMLGLVR